jgi:hypothetical protein
MPANACGASGKLSGLPGKVFGLPGNPSGLLLNSLDLSGNPAGLSWKASIISATDCSITGKIFLMPSNRSGLSGNDFGKPGNGFPARKTGRMSPNIARLSHNVARRLVTNRKDFNPKTEVGEHTRPGCGWTRRASGILRARRPRTFGTPRSVRCFPRGREKRHARRVRSPTLEFGFNRSQRRQRRWGPARAPSFPWFPSVKIQGNLHTPLLT